MISLEERFVDVVSHLDHPDTDLAPAVVGRLAGEIVGGRSTSGTHRLARRPAFVLATILVVVLTVALVAPAREAVADFFGIGRTKIERVDVDPSSAEGRSVDALGSTVRPDATDVVPETVSTPPVSGASAASSDQVLEDIGEGMVDRFGPADRIFVDETRGRSYVWDASEELPAIPDTDVGLVVSVRPSAGPISIKGIGPDVVSEPVLLETRHGPIGAHWIEGEHLVTFGDGLIPLRAQSVLLWAPADVEYRLESNLPRAEAERVAATVLEGTDPFRAG